MDRRRGFVWVVLVALCLGLLLGACGDDEGGDDAAAEGNLEAFCAAADSIGSAGAEPEPDAMSGFIADLKENAPPEIKDDATILADWFQEILDKYEDDPNAQLSPEDITNEVKDAQANFQTYIEANCTQVSPEPDAS